MVKIGLRLPAGYLAGEWDDMHSRSMGSASQALVDLQQAGLQTVELDMMRGNIDPDIARKAYDAVRRAGLAATIHSVLRPLPDDGSTVLPEDLAAVCARARDADAGSSLMVTVHSLASRVDPSAVMVGRTVTALHAWFECVEEQGFSAGLALELNRDNGPPKPGTSYDSLLEIREAVSHAGLGFCWDVGHSHWNYLQGRHSLTPPAEFLAGVIHTHIHDLGPDDSTHYPLTLGNLPLRTYLKALVDAGYHGILSLELAAKRFAELGVDARKSFLESVFILRRLREEMESGLGGQ